MRIISEILSNKKKWEKEYDKTREFICLHIGEDNSKLNTMVKFKFYKSDETVYELQVTDYLINLIFWKPYVKYKIKLGERIINDCCDFTQKYVKTLIDMKVIKILLLETDIDSKGLNKVSIDIVNYLKRVVEDFGTIIGNTLNIYNFNQLRNRNSRFKNLLNTRIPEGLQPQEVEAYIKTRADELFGILKSEDNCLKNVIRCGTGTSPAQLVEFFLSVGPKPDINGNTYPIPINTNMFNYGLDNPTNYLLDGTGGRKAIIMNKKYTGNSGYFSRRLNLVTIGLQLHDNPNYDCHSKHLIEVCLTEKNISRFDGRYFTLHEDSDNFRMLDAEVDARLVGKTVYFRSPVTCACKEDGKICWKCYGKMARQNCDIDIGVLAATEISSRLIQLILSAKHLLKTISEKIEIYDDMNILSLDGNLISLNPDYDSSNGYYIVIEKQFLHSRSEFEEFEDEEDSEESEKRDFIANVEQIDIYHKDKMVSRITEKNGHSFFLSLYLESFLKKSRLKKGKYMIPITSLDLTETLFMIEVENKELTKPLTRLMTLLDSKDHLGCSTINEMVNKFVDLLIESGIGANAFNAEVIIRNLIRDKEHQHKTPNYKKEKINYDILTIKTAIKRHPSPIVSLCFEKLREQFKFPLTYKKKASSKLDYFFIIDYLDRSLQNMGLYSLEEDELEKMVEGF